MYPYGNDHYYHEMIALAEGFEELNHIVIGNCNYWWQPEKNSFLINEAIEDNSFDIAIYDYRYVTSFDHLLFRKGYPNFDQSKKHILVDRNDWLQPIWWKNKHYDIFDFIFAGNLYSNINYAKNIRPWAIGLTKRIMNTIDKYYQNGSKREELVGYNFRVNHNMRGYVLDNLMGSLKKLPAVDKFTNGEVQGDVDKHYFKASTRRHNPEYYKLLCSVRSFMAFGGYYEHKPMRYLPYSILDKIARKPAFFKYKSHKKSNKDFSDEIFIFQQDNFRFWEVLYSGSIAINIDLEYWNFKLPVMPKQGLHYLGIKKLKGNDMERTLSKLSSAKLEKIGNDGREWVTQHYSPKAQAQRILSTLKQ